MMKKITIVSICLLLVGVSIAGATSETNQQVQKTPILTMGTFNANLSKQIPGPNATIVGTVNGSYNGTQNRGRFMGTWYVGNQTGTFKGGYRKIFFIGLVRAMVNGSVRNIPIIGFIRIVPTDHIIKGRFMAPVGPALYFKGTYT